MKNRITVRHGMLGDLREYLARTGWTIEEPVGDYEVLRARKNGYPRPLLIHNRASGGCGYSMSTMRCEAAFDAIFKEYNRLGDLKFATPDGEDGSSDPQEEK